MFFIRPSGYKFVDRGDPTPHDFDIGDFTLDDQWNDLDLSGIIPKGAKLVTLIVLISDNNPNLYIKFRTKGNVNACNMLGAYTQAAGIFNFANGDVKPDTAGIIQYKASAALSDYLFVTVRGWWQ